MRKFTALFLFLILNSPFFIPDSHAGTVQLPRTGQTSCSDANGATINCGGTGQDGNLRAGAPWPNPRFEMSGDCVTDNLTGLVWAGDGNLAGLKTWQGALDYVTSLNSGGGLCGYHDWRLPNRKELKSLVNREEANSATWHNSQGFTNVQASYASYYWSSSTVAYSPNLAWVVNMWDGNVSAVSKSLSYYVWPVRAGQ